MIKHYRLLKWKKVWGYKKQKDGTLIITSYKGEETNVIIPSVIGRGTVTAIDTYAFDTGAPRIAEVLKNSRQEVAFVEIPGTIKNIPDRMFHDAYYYYDWHADEAKFPHASLKTVILHDGIKKIGSSAFGYCIGLESIEIPNSVRKIDDRAFYNCRNLKKIKLPNKKRILSDYAFYRCAFETFDIPEKVTEIPHGLFSGCNSLKKVNMPKGIEVIGEAAFEGCAFENFVVPDTVKKIGAQAFKNCKKLRNIIIPPNVEIDKEAFAGCDLLANWKWKNNN